MPDCAAIYAQHADQYEELVDNHPDDEDVDQIGYTNRVQIEKRSHGINHGVPIGRSRTS